MNRILIIEDELAIAELEKDYLELSDFQVDVETDGEIGAKKAAWKKIMTCSYLTLCFRVDRRI